MQETPEELVQFLGHEVGVSAANINQSTRLLEDLGLDGEDYLLLIERFAEKFSVDVQAYRWFHHHGPEGFNPLWLLIPPWWDQTLYIPITVGDLVESSFSGKWSVRYPDEVVRPRPDLANWIVLIGGLALLGVWIYSRVAQHAA